MPDYVSDPDPTVFSAESYFRTQSAPTWLDQSTASARDFVQRQRHLGRKVVLVTVSAFSLFHLPVLMSPTCRAVGRQCHSRPTCERSPRAHLPRERPISFSAGMQRSLPGQLQCWCVHFLIFSTESLHTAIGTRGATSAEYFLQAGYAVIFLHRQFSLQPFSRHYSHSKNPFLDFLDIESATPSPMHPGRPDLRISVTPDKRAQLLDVLTSYKAVQRAGTLLTLTFVTVNDYLWSLRAVSQELSVLGRGAMYYLAAAVSDFFLPTQKMVGATS